MKGRPPIDGGKRKRHTQTFRVNDEMRLRLLEAAGANQRSISEEVEARLLVSFAAEDIRSIVREAIDEALEARAARSAHDAAGLLYSRWQDCRDDQAKIDMAHARSL